MKTAENLKKVSLVLFIVIGIIHIVSGLMFTNGYLLPMSLIVNRILDIPFAMLGVIYAFMSIYTNIDEKSRKVAGMVFLGISLLVFVFLIYINLFIPDKPLFFPS